MKKVYEIDTWRTNEQANKLNAIAKEAAKKYNGKKFMVSIGEWGVTTYLVFSESKEEAKTLAIAEHGKTTEKIKVRDVTNCKKYQ